MANRLVVSIVGDNRDLKKVLADTQKQLENQTAGMQEVAQGMQKAGASMTKFITMPLIGLGAAAIKSGADFDDAMTKSLAIMNDVTPELRKQMEETARSIVETTTFSSTEAAEAYFFLASAGLDAAQAMEALPKVAKFAQAGNFDLALATDLLTDAQSALGMTIRDDVVKNMENMNRVSDVLVRANTLSNATVQQFSESLTTRAGAALRMVNKDIEEGVAVLAAWADQGVKGAEAGTRLDIVLRDLQNASLKNKDAFAEMGISVFDSDENLRGLADIVADMEVAFDGMSDAQLRTSLMTLGFTDRSIAATTSLLGASDAIKDYEEGLRSSAGFTESVATKQMESFTAQLKQLKNMAVDAGIDIFRELLPALENLFGNIKEGIQWFRGLTDEQKQMYISLAGIIAIAGPVLMIAGRAITAIVTLRTNMVLLNTAIAGKGLTGLILTLTPAIGSLATGLGLLAMNTITTNAAFKDFGKAIADLEKMEQLQSRLSDDSTWWPNKDYNMAISNSINVLDTLYGENERMIEVMDRLIDKYLANEISASDLEASLGALERGVYDYSLTVPWATQATDDLTVAQQVNKQMIESTAEVYDLSEEEAANYLETQGMLVEETNNLAGATDSLYSSLYEVFLLTADVDDKTDQVKKAFEEAEQAIKEYGEGTDEANEKQEQAIRTLDTLITVTVPAIIAKKGEMTEAEITLLNEVDKNIGKSVEWGIVTQEQADETQKAIHDAISNHILQDMQSMYNKMFEIDEFEVDPEIKADTKDATRAIEAYLGLISKIPTSIKTVAEARANIVWSKAEGGPVPEASQGMMLPSFDTGGVLAMLHPPEVVLNGEQALNLVWNASQGKLNKGSEQTITNTFNIEQLVVREEADVGRIASELLVMQKTSLAGGGIR